MLFYFKLIVLSLLKNCTNVIPNIMDEDHIICFLVSAYSWTGRYQVYLWHHCNRMISSIPGISSPQCIFWNHGFGTMLQIVVHCERFCVNIFLSGWPLLLQFVLNKNEISYLVSLRNACLNAIWWKKWCVSNTCTPVHTLDGFIFKKHL